MAERDTVRILHELLTASNDLHLYTDITHMREFVHEAIINIPGVVDSTVCLRGKIDGDADLTNFSSCRFCAYQGEETLCPYQVDPSYYLIPMNTAEQFYGFVVLKVADWKEFADFRPAAHNFANIITTRLEKIEHESALQRALKKKGKDNEILLREVHHRTKNNLNVVTSLLRMQLETLNDPGAQDALRLSIDRIESIALVHNYLYRSEDLNSINIRDFLEEFSSRIASTYRLRGNIQIIKRIKDVAMEIDHIIPVSLIINELITNSFKYAFPEARGGTLTVDLRNIGDELLELRVGDNGIGLPGDFDFDSARTLGMQLIRALTEQIQGKLSIDRRDGTSFSIVFPRRK